LGSPDGKITNEDIATWRYVIGATIPAYAKSWSSTGLPAFATGGDHLGGYRIVGENGPELESTGASRIFNADQTRNILQGDDKELVMELKTANKKLEQMERRLANIEIKARLVSNG
jgi:hypothetical protein